MRYQVRSIDGVGVVLHGEYDSLAEAKKFCNEVQDYSNVHAYCRDVSVYDCSGKLHEEVYSRRYVNRRHIPAVIPLPYASELLPWKAV